MPESLQERHSTCQHAKKLSAVDMHSHKCKRYCGPHLTFMNNMAAIQSVKSMTSAPGGTFEAEAEGASAVVA